jgi:hypothetical protein
VLGLYALTQGEWLLGGCALVFGVLICIGAFLVS